MSVKSNVSNSRSRPARYLSAAALAAVLGAARAASADIIGFDGFAPINATQDDPSKTTYNGYYGSGATSTFQLTADTIGGQATSGFATTAQTATNFVAQFQYLAQASGGRADGTGFVLQADPRGTAALGAPGGSLAYGGTTPITPSVAVLFNIYNGGLGVTTNGTSPTFYTTPNVSITGGYPVDVKISYYGTTLTTAIRDLSTGRVYTRSDTVNIPATVGPAALVGFTGATGGFTATQVVSNFAFRNTTGIYAPLAVTGFTHDAIVEASAAGQTNVRPFLTATMDNGSAASNDQLGGATFYQRGYVPASPTTGLPTGQVFTSASDASHTFALASATGPNAVLLNASNSTGTLTLGAPAAFTALSFLTSTGNGSGTFTARLIHANGAADETITGIASSDWFDGGGTALNASGRVNPDGSTDNVGATNPRLYQADVTLADTVDPISAIELTYGGGTGNTFVFGVSGINTAVAAVPEPATIGALTVAAGLALARRRRRPC